MYQIKTYTVVPAIPAPIAGLRTLAYNLWWSWNHDAVALFHRLDRRLWSETGHNPIRLLAEVSQERLGRVANDSAYLAHLGRVMTSLEDYLQAPTWYAKSHPDLAASALAYFSMEFGLHESLPMYSGGLGVLAGDHMKSASDLGVPLVGVGLLYRHGYFQQYLSRDGWQFEEYPDVDVHHLPAEIVRNGEGRPLLVHIPVGDRVVAIQIYKLNVGRNQVYLLDTNLPENEPEDRIITSRLYGGDQEMRIRQEVVLGFGGCCALRAVGVDPQAFHMNEGHSAFLGLERIRHMVETRRLSFDEAREVVAGSTIFTTHTPVPAGIDTFGKELIVKYLSPYAKRMGTTIDRLIDLGDGRDKEAKEPFSMAILALRLSHMRNGVSQLHGEVARDMWRSNWADLPAGEVPIISVTNGVHVRTWLSPEIAQLFERYLGPDWLRMPDDAEAWRYVDDIPDAELWRAHERCRERLVVELRVQIKRQLIRRGAQQARVQEADELFNPEALTIGFARRFAPYKRAALVLRDEQRLLKLMTAVERPVQFIFAGKAHPRDHMGKELIKRLIQFARRTDARHRFAFVENYNIDVARILVQGVDLWLNNPTKPLEASGTSGMKVAPNGGINFSVLDGWWNEGFDGSNGWVVGDGRVYDNADYQDSVDSESIYDTLETEILPTFYERGSDGLPRRWIARMKASMKTCGPRFSAARMVREYAEKLYAPVMRHGLLLVREEFARAKSLASWKTRIQKNWDAVKVESFQPIQNGEMPVGTQMRVRAQVSLGDVKPDEVVVQLFHGPLPTNGAFSSGEAVEMSCAANAAGGDGVYVYDGAIPCTHSGRHGYSVRVMPRNADLLGEFDLSHVKWG